MWLVRLTLFATTLVLFVADVTSNNKWCDQKYDCIDTEAGQRFRHSMCVYDKLPRECHPRYGWKYVWTDEEKATILDTHNQLRAKVARGEMNGQPQAANMMRMEWDDEAEMIAQKWANQCRIRGHDKCRKNEKGEDMGQNYGWAGGQFEGQGMSAPPRLDMLVMSVKNWVDEEIGRMKKSFVSSYPRMSGVGHYTQVVWANSNRLGCGIAHLISVQGYEGNWEYKLICNYIKRGNLRGTPVYEEGPAASNCPEGAKASKKYLGLCEYPKKYRDFSESLGPQTGKIPGDQQSKADSKPAEQQKINPSKPVLQQQPSRTNSKPAIQPKSRTWFGYDLGSLPIIGRFYRDKPDESQSQNKPPISPPPRGQSTNRPPITPGNKAERPNIDTTAGPKPPITHEQLIRVPSNGDSRPMQDYRIRRPVEEPTGRPLPGYTTSGPTIEEIHDRTAIPMMRVQRVHNSDPFAEMRQRHEDFRRRAFESRNNFMRGFEEMSGVPPSFITSSIFEDDIHQRPIHNFRPFDRSKRR